jgi:hypothetical protein
MPIADLSFQHWKLQLQPTIRNPKSEIRNVERVFYLGYFERRFLGIPLVESKTS